MNIKIEHNIPMPTAYSEGGELAPIVKQMKVGDSIKVDPRIRTSVYAVGRYYGFRMAMRTMPDGTIRAWRVR